MMSVACGGSQKKKRGTAAVGYRDPDAVRYRLLLRDNPVDSGEAFRCFSGCQSQGTPDGYVQCLTACPGFEKDPGFRCAEYEVPPVAACLTARKVDAEEKVDAGLIVLGIVAGTAIVIGLSSVCAASSSSQCNYPASLYPQQ